MKFEFLRSALSRWRRCLQITPQINDRSILDRLMRQAGLVLWVDTIDKSASLMNLGDYQNLYDHAPDRLQKDPLAWMQAIHPDDLERVQQSLPEQRQGTFDVKYRVVHGDGRQLWLRDRALLIRDTDGTAIYRAGLVENITDTVALEEHLRQDQKLKVVGTLAGGIAHDFNNILSIIHGNLELSLLNNPPPEIASFLRTALAAAKRGATTTHRLTAYARQQPLLPGHIPVADLLDEMQTVLEASVDANIELSLFCDGQVWGCYADRGELETVLFNLAINARDSLGERGHLIIEARNTELDAVYAAKHLEVSAGDYVCFSVSDNGSGMTGEVIAQAFDPFFSTKESGKGTGLGLSMAHGFAKQSNGHIKIYSEPGSGTTVNLYLPRANDNLAPVGGTSASTIAGSLDGLSCVVVDDDVEVGRVVAAYLENLGCRVHVFTTPEDVLNTIEVFATADILLTDIILRGSINGPELAKTVHKKYPTLPVIFMSGYTENAIIHHGRLDQGVLLLQKPFSREELASLCIRSLATATPKPTGTPKPT